MLLQGWQSAGKNLDPGSEIFIFLADLEISFWRNLPFASKLSLPNAGQLDASSCPKEAHFPRLLQTVLPSLGEKWILEIFSQGLLQMSWG